MDTQHYYPVERRRHPRTRLHMVLHGINLDPEARDVRDTLEMVDISRSGLGAMAERWMYPGHKIVLTLPVHPEGGRRNVYATVMRCRRSQERFRVGLQFDSLALGAVAGTTAVAVAA